MSTTKLEDYLASDEKLLMSFSAESVSHGVDENEKFKEMVENKRSQTGYLFGATDRRIVYLTQSGSFKDIEYSHISSIESEVEVDNSEEGGALAVGCCGGVFALAALGSFSDDPGTAFMALLLGGGMLAIAAKMLQNAESTEKQKVNFITGDEFLQQLEVTLSPEVEGNIGAELSRILRDRQ